MTDNLDSEISAWLDFAKGDLPGHEFRGNQYQTAHSNWVKGGMKGNSPTTAKILGQKAVPTEAQTSPAAAAAVKADQIARSGDHNAASEAYRDVQSHFTGKTTYIAAGPRGGNVSTPADREWKYAQGAADYHDAAANSVGKSVAKMGSQYLDANLPENLVVGGKLADAASSLSDRSRALDEKFEAGASVPLDTELPDLADEHNNIAQGHLAIAGMLSSQYPSALRAIGYHEAAADAHKMAADVMTNTAPKQNGYLNQTGWKLTHPAFLLSQKAHTQTALDTASGVVKSESQSSIAGESLLVKDATVTDIDNATEEWVLQFWKGGPGSGEHDGHPFRGNRYTNAIHSADHHNVRAGTTHFGHEEHLAAATAHNSAAQTLMRMGKFNQAADHFREAAYHGAQAAKQLQTPGGLTQHSLGQNANSTYEENQQASQLARLASRTGDVNDAANAQDAASKSAITAGQSERMLGQIGRGEMASQSTALANR
jgi:hypothetical protein